MKFAMPAAILAGGASRRMGRSKAALAYGAGTLLEFQTGRLAAHFEDVFVVVKEAPAFPFGPARVVLDRTADHAAIHGLVRALEEARDRVFVLGVDLPAVTAALVRAIVERSLASEAAAVVPRADGRLQPLAAVWRRAALSAARRRVAAGELSLQELARSVGAEIFEEEDWKAVEPSAAAFANLNTLEEYAAMRGRA
ncbi:MAG TPA: molybdenum cofactor guanylyltransferase [Thermoanaerobaculia bacterium]